MVSREVFGASSESSGDISRRKANVQPASNAPGAECQPFLQITQAFLPGVYRQSDFKISFERLSEMTQATGLFVIEADGRVSGKASIRNGFCEPGEGGIMPLRGKATRSKGTSEEADEIRNLKRLGLTRDKSICILLFRNMNTLLNKTRGSGPFGHGCEFDLVRAGTVASFSVSIQSLEA